MRFGCPLLGAWQPLSVHTLARMRKITGVWEACRHAGRVVELAGWCLDRGDRSGSSCRGVWRSTVRTNWRLWSLLLAFSWAGCAQPADLPPLDAEATGGIPNGPISRPPIATGGLEFTGGVTSSGGTSGPASGGQSSTSGGQSETGGSSRSGGSSGGSSLPPPPKPPCSPQSCSQQQSCPTGSAPCCTAAGECGCDYSWVGILCG